MAQGPGPRPGRSTPVPGLRVGDDGGPHGLPDAALAETLLRALANGLPAWDEAFRARAAERDHLATKLILEPLGAEPGADVEALTRKREEDLRECRRELELALRDTRK